MVCTRSCIIVYVDRPSDFFASGFPRLFWMVFSLVIFRGDLGSVFVSYYGLCFPDVLWIPN